MKRVYVNFSEMMEKRSENSKENSISLFMIFHKIFFRFHRFKILMMKTSQWINLIKSFFYWVLAYLYRTPGLDIHRKIVFLYYQLWKKNRIDFIEFYHNAVYPLDSVRYFEFYLFFKQLKNKKLLGNYLDISSPRMLFTLLLKEFPDLKVNVVNPDLRDLEISMLLLEKCNFTDRCNFYNKLIEDLDFPDESFDTITCMSVIEHIPGDKDKKAVQKLWKLLKPGGRMIVSVPVCKQSYEEYVDIDFYGLLGKQEGYSFGQRFYDGALLHKCFTKNCTTPSLKVFFGEKTVDSYNSLREKKMIESFGYPAWRESCWIGKNSNYFEDINKMPGIGVVVLEFVKESNLNL